MTDDIVTRLRDSAKYCGTDGNVWAERDCLEAADEIERLRADRDRWKNGLTRLVTIVDDSLFYADQDGEEYNNDEAFAIHDRFIDTHRDLYYEALRND